MELISIIIVISGLVALVFAGYLVFKIRKESSGTEKMQEISNAIRGGAIAFLNSENKVLIIFVAAVTVILLAASFIQDSGMHWGTAVAFIIGALLSMLSGNIGMRIATIANAKTAQGAKTSVNKGLSIAFSSGAVMGICVVGRGVPGVFGMFLLFSEDLRISASLTTNTLFGFAFDA